MGKPQMPRAAPEAVGLGYDAVLPEDRVAGASPETHAMQISILSMVATVMTADAVRDALSPEAFNPGALL